MAELVSFNMVLCMFGVGYVIGWVVGYGLSKRKFEAGMKAYRDALYARYRAALLSGRGEL